MSRKPPSSSGRAPAVDTRPMLRLRNVQTGECLTLVVDDDELHQARTYIPAGTYEVSRASTEADMSRPTCPACGSDDGFLGTEHAYFICRNCKGERYWTPDHKHPCDSGMTWEQGAALSPWRRAVERPKDATE